MESNQTPQTVNPTPSPVQPIEPKKKINPLLIIFGIVLLLLALGTGFLFVQNTNLQKEIAELKTISSPLPALAGTPVAPSSSTSDWKSYTNDKYGISFSYPNTYIIQADESDTNPFSINIYTDNSNNKLLLSFHFDEARQSILDYYKASGDEVLTQSPSEMPTINLLSSTYPTTRFNDGEGHPSDYGNCNYSYNSYTYFSDIDSSLLVQITDTKEVTCNPDGTEKIARDTTEEELKTAKDILSTFKFTN